MSSERIQITEPSAGVIQSPDGEIHYYTKLQNKHNPYLHKSPLNEEANLEYVEVNCNGEQVLISLNDINKAIKLECKACSVRFLCLLDFTINLLISFSTNYLALSSAFIAGISLMGYISTMTYNRKGLIFYLIYQYLQSISKIGILIIYIAAATSSEFKQILASEQLELLKPTSQNIALISITTIGQIYITYFVQNFYNLMPTHIPNLIRSDTIINDA